jgi:hypothetical protein
MADRKYGRIFTMSDVQKIIEWYEMNGVNPDFSMTPFDEAIDEMDEVVRFKFPYDEPTFTLRGRDQRAIGAIRFYEDHQSPRAPVGFIEGIEDARRDFVEYRDQHPEMMKEPD